MREADPWMIMGSYNRINGKSIVYKKIRSYWQMKFVENGGFPIGIRNGLAVRSHSHLQDPAVCIKSKLSLEMPKAIVYSMDRFTNGL